MNKNLIKSTLVATLIIFVAFVNIISAQEIYNETSYFNGGGTLSQTISTTSASNSSSFSGRFITFFKMNTDNIKQLQSIDTPSNGNPGQWYLNTNANGINQKYVPVSIYQGTTKYCDGVIGWNRNAPLTGTSFSFHVECTNINTTFSNSLSGWKNFGLVYDKSIFNDYISNTDNNLGDGRDTATGSDAYLIATARDTLGTPTFYQYVVRGNSVAGFTFNDVATITYNNLSQNFGYLNITKNNHNFELQLTNFSNGIIYDVVSTLDSINLINVSLGLKYNLRSVSSDSWVNRTILNIGGNTFEETNIIGNISTNKLIYNKTESVNISYNLSINSSVTDRKIKIRLPTLEVINNFISDGYNQFFSFYIPDTYPIGSYIIYLQYEKDGSWYTLDTKYFNVTTINQNSMVEFLYPSYDLSQRLSYQYYTNQSGYIVLKDSNNNIMQNTSSLSINTLKELTYNFKQSDLTGIWNIYLYDSNNSIISSDTANINFGIIPNVNITSIPIIEDNSMLNAGGTLGKAFIGTLDTDSNGDIQNSLHNKNIGMNAFYTLSLIVFLIFIFGSIKKVRGK